MKSYISWSNNEMELMSRIEKLEKKMIKCNCEVCKKLRHTIESLEELLEFHHEV